MLKQRRIELERAEKFISPLYFTEANLLGGKLDLVKENPSFCGIFPYLEDDKRVFERLLVWEKRPLFGEIPKESKRFGDYVIGEKGMEFGPTWSTVWFKIVFSADQLNSIYSALQAANASKGSLVGEWELHFHWDTHSEALLYDENGSPLCAFNAGQSHMDDQRSYFRIQQLPSPNAKVTKDLVYYVEVACNYVFGAGKGDAIAPPDPNLKWRLHRCELVVFDRLRHDLINEFSIVVDIAKSLPEDSLRGNQALYTANEFINACNIRDRSTWRIARNHLTKFLSQENGTSQFQVHAIGHCHIDSAWLWTYAETRRKAARSFASQVNLMDTYPEFKFACSQAVQYQWVKESHPLLFERIKFHVERGAFVPVGGSWVEMDGNLPSGESFVRQFLFGQRFFQQEFGKTSSIFWLPDTFGYTAQLPQLVSLAGMKYFLTQKLSWNLFNKFPHHTFYWQGLDGTKVLTHFPPADDYNSQVKAKELVKCVTNFKDKMTVDSGMMLFGNGDGGGGPTHEMLQRARILKNVDGLPKLQITHPEDYFNKILVPRLPSSSSSSIGLSTWVGELYFELHRGTYTTQAYNKKMNRFCEVALQRVEALSTIKYVDENLFEHNPQDHPHQFIYPSEEINQIWSDVLLHQFHDVLPGSSIEDVYKDTRLSYDEMWQKLKFLQDKLVVGREGVWNTLGVERKNEIVRFNSLSQPFLFESIPPFGHAHFSQGTEKGFVSVVKGDKLWVMKNDIISVTIDVSTGIITNILFTFTSHSHHHQNRQVVKQNSGGCNQFILYDDVPLYWDAWDVEAYHKQKPIHHKVSDVKAELIVNTPILSTIEISMKLNDKCSIRQRISLQHGSARIDFDTEVDWHESHVFLKVAFPVNVHSSEASYDVPFGIVKRPTHSNTSWDTARFEVCGHKWASINDHGFGVALLNNCKYGYDIHESTMTLSLLRSSKKPDANADMGVHSFKYAILPHAASTPQEGGVIDAALCFNNPVVVNEYHNSHQHLMNSTPLIFSSESNMVIDTLKRAESVHETALIDIIVRVYEAYGSSHTNFNIYFRHPTFAKKNYGLVLRNCNLLEDEFQQSPSSSSSSDHLHIHTTTEEGNDTVDFPCVSNRPFQIMTLRITVFHQSDQHQHKKPKL